MNNLPWTEKYRPKTLNNVVGHIDKINTLKSMTLTNSWTHLLFYGPPGTGKTSTILALTRKMYGENYKRYILEINASGDRGIATVRGNILNFLKTKSDKVKLVILDEADAMTKEAQSALRVIIEDYSHSARFCLICNNINDIIDGIQSRCNRMRFSSPDKEAMIERLENIAVEEDINITTGAIETLIDGCSDFRKTLNNLQGIKPLYDSNFEITETEVNQYLKKPSNTVISDIFQQILNTADYDESYQILLDLYRDNQIDIDYFMNTLFTEIRKTNLISDPTKHFIIRNIATIDERLQLGCSVEIQLGFLTSTIKTAQRLNDIDLDLEQYKDKSNS